ncbi:MAG: hypothetical protein HY736_26415 [Verrucomicrobia bacterium]|nr:hypothetical protein [Verrucomicrobiota bacterium]
MKGPFIIVAKTGAVFGATHVEATPEGYTIFLKGIQHQLKARDLEIVYAVDARKPAARIDPGLISTLVWLENALVEFNRKNPPTHITLFGAGSLAFTILPERSTNDLDMIVSDELAAFLNAYDASTDVVVELLDENLLLLLGPWATRACEVIGPRGTAFRLVHPLDTAMQKLLRYDEERFIAKDQPDIEQIIAQLEPNEASLINLLTENPARYARLMGRFAAQADAIERNTRWFLHRFLPQLTFEDIIRQTGDRAVAPASKAGLLPSAPKLTRIQTDLRPQLNPRMNFNPPEQL